MYPMQAYKPWKIFNTVLIKECLNHLIALTHIEPQGFISRNRFSSNLGTFSSNLYIFAIVEWPKCDKTHQSTLVAMYSRMGFNMRYGASLGLQILEI